VVQQHKHFFSLVVFFPFLLFLAAFFVSVATFVSTASAFVSSVFVSAAFVTGGWTVCETTGIATKLPDVGGATVTAVGVVALYFPEFGMTYDAAAVVFVPEVTRVCERGGGAAAYVPETCETTGVDGVE